MSQQEEEVQISTKSEEVPLAIRRNKRQNKAATTNFDLMINHGYVGNRSASKSHTGSQRKDSAASSKSKQKKSLERGWYRVEGITGHRMTKQKKRDQIELRVKWEGYQEATWENFETFVKDTAPMVERYILRHAVKPLNDAREEIKDLKKKLAEQERLFS
jgi:hypothetical protein